MKNTMILAASAALFTTTLSAADVSQKETKSIFDFTLTPAEELYKPKTTIGAGYGSIDNEGGVAMLFETSGYDPVIDSKVVVSAELDDDFWTADYKAQPFPAGFYLGGGYMKGEGSYTKTVPDSYVPTHIATDFKKSGWFAIGGYTQTANGFTFDVGYKVGEVNGLSASAAYAFKLDPDTVVGLRVGYERINSDLEDLDRVAAYFTASFNPSF